MKMFNKKLITCILIVSSLLMMTLPAFAVGFDVEAKSAILMEAETGQVLFAKNKDKELPPASMTKIMTLLLAMEAIDSGQFTLDDTVITSEFASSMGGSQIYLAPKEKMKVRTLLEAIAIASANDACVAIGEYIGGTEGSFVAMMNQKVKELDLKHTNFVNSTGLPTDDGEHYSSAYDLAVMARGLVTKHPKVLDWTSTWIDTIRDGEFTLYNTNGLIEYYPGADGLKTGWTDEAGYCLTATAKRDGMRLISVVMQTDSKKSRVEESAKLLSYGFSRFDLTKVVSKGENIGEVKVKNGEKLKVAVETAKDLQAVVKTGDGEIERDVKLNKEVEAPIKQGETVGKLVLTQQDRKVGTVNLVASKSVKKASLLTRLIRMIKEFLLGFFK
ncbi:MULTISPECIES: D-alanyl-D-alanine carboxypeptidase family protein [unclassified Candidatus Frackibacter]|uniref:D-alanyl-D-alanine carboxypeptidase family protein n=1 Tax=unclassified Candidatus Frackibacter TaxID=2648818 RepID=UPI000798A5A2|nr:MULTISPECIES: D-alanyl-D-alanine carboxypeptidase family protein [unclassified Candidatus Frackibacter]KXS45672.1 MAG: D-alanyl-D-alanine carboxypeptidase (penicillin-binding protein 5/6) [Candidatus Frackibacter sp. T328-2]SDC66557.1 D-alanyl-D-alanine carboxypeptidase (penicillin-binding protein 5/6) [Candidatus Frackibacter sp. WG11]SEM79744.1 D-alanyl-D-alanine carboxypeptidase (penicillin-binding protein 5/6) [Candidatus Frackibacter sp. WG12]SFL90436.1 D-alanyl-D-alanine carboxypeptida